MKKALIITTCIALLFCIFCLAASAEDNWSDIPAENDINISAIIKILVDNGLTVDTEAPFESATGAIQFSPAITGTNIHSTITVADLINNFDSEKYYYFYATFSSVNREDPAIEIRANNTTLVADIGGYATNYPIQLTGTETIYIVVSQGSINQIANLRATAFDYEMYIYGTPSAWIESADYDTGYIYAEEGEGGLISVMSAIISILVGGIAAMATGIGGGLSALVKAIFTVADPITGAVTGLSTFGGVIIVFAGISLAVGISRFVVSWVTSLGNN